MSDPEYIELPRAKMRYPGAYDTYEAYVRAYVEMCTQKGITDPDEIAEKPYFYNQDVWMQMQHKYALVTRAMYAQEQLWAPYARS